MSPLVGVAVGGVSVKTVCLDILIVSTNRKGHTTLSHILQVVETGKECLSGGYIDLYPGTASTMPSTGPKQVSKQFIYPPRAHTQNDICVHS